MVMLRLHNTRAMNRLARLLETEGLKSQLLESCNATGQADQFLHSVSVSYCFGLHLCHLVVYRLRPGSL